MPTGIQKSTDVPPDKVDEVIANYNLDGPVDIKKEEQPDGNWTITATFPDK